jgi:hypothetical protein
MQASKVKNGIIALLLACIGILTTCEYLKPSTQEITPLQDTLFLSQWRREKKAKLEMIAGYESKITKLQHERDSLQNLVGESKKTTSAYRFKAKQFERQLKEAIVNVVQKDSLGTDSISPILDSLIVVHDQSDNACDTTIQLLETIVANCDSSILFQRQIEGNLRYLNTEAELRNKYLTDQLNIAFKSQRKKSRQNKILAGGILLLSGITTSMLLTQTLK